MPISVFHALTATTPDNTNFEIRPLAHWNNIHVATANLSGSEIINAFSLTVIGVGNTTGQSSSSTMPFNAFSIDGTGAVSVGFSNGSFMISAPATAALTQFSGGMSTAGNTAGTASLATAQLVIVGSNNISLSQSFNLGSATLSIIGTGGLAIVASNTTFTSGTVVLSAAGGAITISNGAQSALFSVPATSLLTGIGGMTISTAGNTVSISAPAVSILTGASGLTVSSAGSTISVGAILQSRWDAWPMGQSTSQQQTNASASFRYIQLEQGVTFTRVDVPCLVSMSNAATTATADMNVSSGLVIYTRNASTLSPITGAFGTTTYTWASNSSNYSNLTGGKNFSFPINGSLTPGEYWVGFQISTTDNSSIGLSTTLLGNTISMILGASYSASQIDDFGATYSASQNVISQGMYTATITATNQTIAMSNISAVGTNGMAGNFPVIFRNY